jgi:hypothetical protein
MPDTVLEWEITSQEARERTLQSFPVVGQLLAFFAFFTALREKSWTIFFTTVGLIIIFYILAAAFAKFKPKKYRITETGVTISKGDKQKTYAWHEFECFYTYNLIRNAIYKKVKSSETRITTADIASMWADLSRINGTTYYLKKKKKTFWDKFYKTFVAVQAEPENSRQVGEALSIYIPHQNMGPWTDAGPVRYEFK